MYSEQILLYEYSRAQLNIILRNNILWMNRIVEEKYRVRPSIKIRSNFLILIPVLPQKLDLLRLSSLELENYRNTIIGKRLCPEDIYVPFHDPISFYSLFITWEVRNVCESIN